MEFCSAIIGVRCAGRGLSHTPSVTAAAGLLTCLGTVAVAAGGDQFSRVDRFRAGDATVGDTTPMVGFAGGTCAAFVP